MDLSHFWLEPLLAVCLKLVQDGKCLRRRGGHM